MEEHNATKLGEISKAILNVHVSLTASVGLLLESLCRNAPDERLASIYRCA
jgi:hypothetical protein